MFRCRRSSIALLSLLAFLCQAVLPGRCLVCTVLAETCHCDHVGCKHLHLPGTCAGHRVPVEILAGDDVPADSGHSCGCCSSKAPFRHLVDESLPTSSLWAMIGVLSTNALDLRRQAGYSPLPDRRERPPDGQFSIVRMQV